MKARVALREEYREKHNELVKQEDWEAAHTLLWDMLIREQLNRLDDIYVASVKLTNAYTAISILLAIVVALAVTVALQVVGG